MPVSIHRSSFIKLLREEFPDIEPWLQGYRDNITMEMMRFQQFTEDRIERGDFDTVRRCFLFANTLLERDNRSVRNSLVVTYLEHLALTGPGGEAAKNLLPSPLATEREEIRAYMERVSKTRTQPRTRPGAA